MKILQFLEEILNVYQLKAGYFLIWDDKGCISSIKKVSHLSE